MDNNNNKSNFIINKYINKLKFIKKNNIALMGHMGPIGPTGPIGDTGPIGETNNILTYGSGNITIGNTGYIYVVDNYNLKYITPGCYIILTQNMIDLYYYLITDKSYTRLTALNINSINYYWNDSTKILLTGPKLNLINDTNDNIGNQGSSGNP